MHELIAETEPRRVQIEVGAVPSEVALAIVEHLEALSKRLDFAEQALAQTVQFVAALAASGNRDHETTIETLRALVSATESLQAAAMNARATPAPPTPSRKTVTFERDPLTRLLTSAQVIEGGDTT